MRWRLSKLARVELIRRGIPLSLLEDCVLGTDTRARACEQSLSLGRASDDLRVHGSIGLLCGGGGGPDDSAGVSAEPA